MTTTSSRQFDIQTDKAYDPDSMSDVYLMLYHRLVLMHLWI